MATYKIPTQDLSLSIPDENQVFRIKGGEADQVFGIIQGGKLYTTSVKGLGQGDLTPYAIEGHQGRYNIGGTSMDEANAYQMLGIQKYNELGLGDWAALPEYNQGDILTANITQGQGDVYSLIKGRGAVVPGGVTTKTIDPNNPNAAIDVAGDVPLSYAAPENYLQNLLGSGQGVGGAYSAENTALPQQALQDPLAGVKAVFGTEWQPAPIFQQKGLVQQGIYGAVRVTGTPNVFTIGPGGKMLSAEEYKNLFGTDSQEGIVGEVTPEQAAKLGINPGSIYQPPQATGTGAIGSEALSGGQKSTDMSGTIPNSNSPIASAGATIEAANQTIKQISDSLKPAETAASKQSDTLTSSLNTLLEQMYGKSAMQATEEEKAGVKIYQENLKNLQNEIMVKTAAFQKLYADINAKPITMSSIIGAEAQARRVAEADIGFLTAQAQAMQNNITFAKQIATDAVNAKYQPIEDEINIKLQQLKLLEPTLSAEESRWAAATEIYLNQQKQASDEEKANEKQINDLTLENIFNYPSSGIKMGDSIETQQKKILGSAEYKQAVEAANKKTETADITEYNMAVSQGYKGTFQAWQKEQANLKVKLNAPQQTQTERLLASQQTIINSTRATLEQQKGQSQDGFANPDTYRKAKTDYIAAGGTAADFFQALSPAVYVSPENRVGDLNIYKTDTDKRMTASTIDQQTLAELNDDISKGASLQQLYGAYSEISPALIQSIYYNR